MDEDRLRGLVADGVLDAELASLLLVLGGHGVPLVLATREPDGAAALARALAGLTGTLAADSLDEVARLGGGSASAGLPDELRDMGVVVVARRLDGRLKVVAAHYIRPLERDAGGHIQRRGPAVLVVFDEQAAEWEHFAWGVEAELADRAGIPLRDFARQLEARRADLVA
jgi:hypothetical protein